MSCEADQGFLFSFNEENAQGILGTLNYGKACEYRRKGDFDFFHKPNQLYVRVLNRIINPEFKAGFFWNNEKDLFIDNWVEVVEESWG